MPLRRYTLEQLNGGAPLPESERERLRDIDLSPWTRVAGRFGEVRVLTFSRWGGFAWYYHLRWPHHVDRVETDTVLPYRCGTS